VVKKSKTTPRKQSSIPKHKGTRQLGCASEQKIVGAKFKKQRSRTVRAFGLNFQKKISGCGNLLELGEAGSIPCGVEKEERKWAWKTGHHGAQEKRLWGRKKD